VKKELKLDKLEVKLNPVTSSTAFRCCQRHHRSRMRSTTNTTEREKQVSFTNTPLPDANRYVRKVEQD